MLSRRSFLTIAASAPVILTAAGPALARAPQTFQTSAGIAINGIDPVAYFTDARPVPGTSAFTASYKGASWHFISAANRDAFMANPNKYGAKFGGYCAYAASLGYLAPTIPEAWTVYKGHLYLNANLRAQELWLQDVPGNIAKGEKNWPAILDA